MGARSASAKGASAQPRSAAWGVKATLGRALVAATLAFGALAAAGLSTAGPAGAVAPAGAFSGAPAPPFAHACGTPLGGHAACTAIRLLTPARNWHPTPAAKGSGHGRGGSSST